MAYIRRKRKKWQVLIRKRFVKNIAKALSQPSNTSTKSGTSLSTGFTKVCYYNGVGEPSALTVRSTSICPITNSHNVSGLTKICHYPKAMGGPKALTVRATSICPINYPR